MSSDGCSPHCRTSFLFIMYLSHPIMKKTLKMWIKWSRCNVGVVSMPALNPKVTLFTISMMQNVIKLNLIHPVTTFQCHIHYQNHWISETTQMMKSCTRWLELHDKFILFKTLNWISCDILYDLPLKSELCWCLKVRIF